MNKVKKTLIALFSSLFFVCTLLFVAACNNGKTLYKIAVECDTAKGSITLTDSEDPEGYAQGEEVTATVKANEGYEIGAVTVNEASVELTGGGTYTFEVEGDTTIKATFTATEDKGDGGDDGGDDDGGDDDETVSFEQNYIGAWDIFYEQPLAVNKPETVWHGLTLTIAADSLTLAEAAASDTEVIYTVSDIAADANGGYTFKAQGGDLTWTAHIVLFAEDNAIKAEGTPAEGAAQTAVFIKDGVSPKFAPTGLESTEWETADKASTLSIGEDGDIFFGEDPVFLLTCTDGTDGTHSFTGIYHADYVTGTLSSEAVSLTVGGTTYAFAPKAASITFPVDYRGDWVELGGDGTHTVGITKDTFTFGGQTYAVTASADADGNPLYTVTIDGTTYNLSIGYADWVLILDGFTEFDAQMTYFFVQDSVDDLMNLTMPAKQYAGTYVCEDEDSAPELEISADGVITFMGGTLQLFATDTLEEFDDATVWYLIDEDGMLYTFVCMDPGFVIMDYSGEMSFTYTPATTPEISFTAAQQGEWKQFAQTVASFQHTIKVNEKNVTVDDVDCELSLTDEYGDDYTYYSFKINGMGFEYILYFLGDDTLALRSGSFAFYNKSGETPELAFPDDYKNTTWTCDNRFGDITIDGDGKATWGVSGTPVTPFAITTEESGGGELTHTITTVHAFYNGAYWQFTISEKQIYAEQVVGGLSYTFTPLEPGPIESGDVADYQGTWKFFGEDDKTVIIDAQGNLTYDGEQCGVLKNHDDSYTFATGGTSYTLGLTYIVNGKAYLLFVSNKDGAEFYLEEGKTVEDLPVKNEGLTAYAGTYTYTADMESGGYTLTLTVSEAGVMSISWDGEPVELYAYSIGMNSDDGVYIVDVFMNGIFYEAMFEEGQAVFHALRGQDLTFTDGSSHFGEGGDEGGGADEVTIPTEFGGTWTAVTDSEAILTLTEGTSTFTLDLSALYMGVQECTVTAVDENGLTFSAGDMTGLTVKMLDAYGSTPFIVVDVSGTLIVYYLNEGEEWTELFLPAAYRGTSWTSDDVDPLTVDAEGKISEDLLPYTIFAQQPGVFGNTHVAYAVQQGRYSTYCYQLTFSGDTLTRVDYSSYDTETGEFYDTAVYTKSESTGDEGVALPSYFAGDWTQINAPADEGEVLELANGAKTVTFMGMPGTIISADQSGFTADFGDNGQLTFAFLEDSDSFLTVDLGGSILIFALDTDWFELHALAPNLNTSWTSDLGGSLSIDAQGVVTWTKLEEAEGTAFKIFYRNSDGSVYALYNTTCYIITFGTDEITVESCDYDFNSEEPSETYTFTKEA